MSRQNYFSEGESKFYGIIYLNLAVYGNKYESDSEF